MSDGVATLGATDQTKTMTEQTKLVEGRFPAFRDILQANPREKVRRIAVDGKRLAALLTAMTKIAGDSEYSRVEIEFGEKDSGPIRLFNRSDEMTAAGLLMPLSD